MTVTQHTHKKNFHGLQVLLASPEDIKSWSHGSVENSDTINYRTGKPKQKGLFCEAIFGPMKNFECGCGKYKGVRYKGIVCERCGVEVTTSRVRRERMGHIELAAPVVHIWYIKATPSRVGLLLNLSVNEIEKILYYVKYVVTAINDKQKKHIIASLEKDYQNKLVELDELYSSETKNLADQASTKKAKELLAQEEELKRLYTTNKTDIEREYSRVKSILANLKVGSTILESDYRNIFYKYETVFTFASGSQAILNLLKQVDIEKTIQSLITLFPRSKGEERKKMFKKLKLLINLYISGVKPDRMVLTYLPVIPPDLRPVVQLEGGKFASSDVNQFYRRVLMRNLRLKRMIQVGMPDVVKKNEIRLLQESVNNLLVGEKVEVGKGSGSKVFKSLTDMLSGKEGIFRKNLLGKRVDYSGRSVITVGPNLQLDECGLPLYIAVKIFTPFIIGKLIERKISHTPKQAEKLIKDEHPIALSILEEVIKDKYVLLNRAPTLHRLSIQAFKIKLMPGKTVRIHPLVCPAFNADFDGDQMAVHLPLSEEAQYEAHSIISAAQNVLAPASGEPVITHSQDMVLGIYYLTDDPVNDHIKGTFATIEDALSAYNAENIHIHDLVRVKISDDIVTTTLGRIIFHSILPQGITFSNEKIGKKGLKRILNEVYDLFGREATVIVADAIKEIGFKFATLSSTTINVFDLTVPPNKSELIHLADEKVAEISNLWWRGFLSDNEKHRQIIQLWSEVNAEIAKLVKVHYQPGTSLYRMIDSGARGTRGQLTQIAGMKGLVVSPSGEIIELPVKSSLIEGFRPIEYFISAHGARKGKADTALRTAESGYLTRRLVDSSQEVVVREFDCGTHNFILVTKDEADIRQEKFDELIYGRTLAEDLYDTRGVVIAHAGALIDKHLLQLILTEDIDMIKARSALTCKTTSGVCQQCFGMDLSSRKLVDIGSPIGVISSQSIGEPGTQLTMRTFHTGGVAKEGGDITQGIRRVEELFEIRNPKKPAIIAPFDGTVIIEEGVKKVDIEIVSEPIPKTYIIKEGYNLKVNSGDYLQKGGSYAEKGKSKLMVKEEGKILEVHNEYIVLGTVQRVKKKLSVGTTLKVKHNSEVFKGQLLSSGQIDIREYMQIVGDLETQRYIVKEIKKVYTSQGQNVNDKYMEIIIKQLFSKIVIEDAGNSSFVPGSIAKYEEFVRVNEQLKEEGKQLTRGIRLALGLTNIAKETDSWLSAASFQETIRVMVEASTKGSIDRLDDLKSNVILGRLLPVGNEYKKRYFGEDAVEELVIDGPVDIVDEESDEDVVTEDVVSSYVAE